MDISQHLIQAGLGKSEIRVYLYLLEGGLSSVPQIAKGTRILRPNCYATIKLLQEKGFLDKQEHGKRLRYNARDPLAIVAKIEQNLESVKQILPDLRALSRLQINKPVIKFYTGIQDIQLLATELLGSKSEILGMTSTSKLYELAPKFWAKFHRELRISEIFLRDIITYESGEVAAKSAKERMGPYYNYRFLAKKYDDISSDIIVWDNHIALITLDEPIFATKITSTALSGTFKNIWQIIWSQAIEPSTVS